MIKNPKVGIYYEKDNTGIDTPYLYIECETTAIDKGVEIPILYKIHKIDLEGINVSQHSKLSTSYYKDLKLNPIVTRISTLNLNMLPDNNGAIWSFKMLEPTQKEMTKEEIEKELGYKIKIKD